LLRLADTMDSIADLVHNGHAARRRAWLYRHQRHLRRRSELIALRHVLTWLRLSLLVAIDAHLCTVYVAVAGGVGGIVDL